MRYSKRITNKQTKNEYRKVIVETMFVEHCARNGRTPKRPFSITMQIPLSLYRPGSGYHDTLQLGLQDNPMNETINIASHYPAPK